jgi:hypothetical protein
MLQICIKPAAAYFPRIRNAPWHIEIHVDRMSDLFAKVSGSIHIQVLQTCISQAAAQKIRNFISKLIHIPEFLVPIYSMRRL